MMKYLRSALLGVAVALAACGPAAAQWQTPNHSVPVGRGAGITGFGNAPAGAAGTSLVSNGASSDPTFQVPPVPSGFVPALLAPTTFFLNGDSANSQPCGAFICSPGKDTNNCLTITTPCLTIQHTTAFVAANYNFAGQTVIVQASKGTYNECVLLPPYLTTNPTDKLAFLQGNPTVSDVVVNCASGNTFTSVASLQGWVLKNISAQAPAGSCVFSDYNGRTYWDGGDFVCSNFSAQAALGGFVEFVNHPYTVSANSLCHVGVVNGGNITWNNVTANMIGTPAFAVGLFCSQKNYGVIDDSGLTISGGFSGPKYVLQGVPITFSTGTTATTAGTTQFIGQGSISATENNFFVVPFTTAGMVDLYVNATASPGVGKTYVFTLRVNGSASALTCTMSGGAQSTCKDQNNLGFGTSLQVTAGDVIDLQVVSTAGANTAIISAGVVPHN